MANQDFQSLLPEGTQLQSGKYRVERYLSSGNFGNTYVIVNTLFGERLAMKEFFLRGFCYRDSDGRTVSLSQSVDPERVGVQLDKFRKEARRLRNLTNEHLVHVHDMFEENGTVYYVMDYVQGESLSSYMERMQQPLSEGQTLYILNQLLEALEEVHGQNIWHLDLKPENIMIDKDGKVVIIDFGASKQMGLTGKYAGTTGILCYTPGYAPLEQVSQDLDSVGPWTDIYALGATLYNLLTGQQPPMITQLQNPASVQFPKTVSKRMRDLVLWMMSPNREQRPQAIAPIRNYLSQSIPQQGKGRTQSPTPAPSQPQTATPFVQQQQAATPPPQQQAAVPPVLNDDDEEEPSGMSSSTKKLIIAALALVAVGALVWLLSLKGGDKADINIANNAGTSESMSADVPSSYYESATSDFDDYDEDEYLVDSVAVFDDSELFEDAAIAFEPEEESIDDVVIEEADPIIIEEAAPEVSNQVFDVVEQMPSFPGGDAALMQFLGQHIRYPVVAEENGIQGRVVASFIVETDGSVSNITVIKSVDPSLDKEAVRVLGTMPRWVPGKQNGAAVRVRYTVPVTFRLQ